VPISASFYPDVQTRSPARRARYILSGELVSLMVSLFISDYPFHAKQACIMGGKHIYDGVFVSRNLGFRSTSKMREMGKGFSR